MDFQAQSLAESDVSEILNVQSLCFPSVEPESAKSFSNKIKKSPDTCWGIFKQNKLKAYLIALPWVAGSPLNLNQEDVTCANPDCLYLHDLAVLKEMQGSGAAQTLLSCFFEALRSSSFRRAALVAIQGSKPYWQRHGFQTQATSKAVNDKLDSYGTEAFYMEYRCD